MPNKDLSETLKRLRNEIRPRLSQAKVAQAIGVPKSTLGSWENCLSEPNADTLMRLFHFYGVRDVYSLFGLASVPEVKNNTLNEKYNQLNEENRSIIDVLIDKLLALQKAGCNGCNGCNGLNDAIENIH